MQNSALQESVAAAPRARHTRSMSTPMTFARAVACLPLLALAGCGGATSAPTAVTSSSAEWEQLPEPPISGRVDALVASVGDSIVVAGGWNWLCPPGADCSQPETPPYADGAAYDLNAGRWRRIADAPVGLRALVSAVHERDIYALSQCEQHSTCPAGQTLLRYRSDDDAWEQLPAPPEPGLSGRGLVSVADGLVAFTLSDEVGTSPDYRFVVTEQRWVELPDDPLPPVYDRFVVEYAGRLLAFGTPLGDRDTRTKL